MKREQINIRDPFVIFEDGKYYLFGTRAKNFGQCVGGFDVYITEDLENFSEPIECFESEKYGLNEQANWAPEVHKYNGKYYMFATFLQKNGLRGTFSLVSDKITGPYIPTSDEALTPVEWECLDGTLYISRDGKPYLVFCHEHTQIKDGTICYAELNDGLSKIEGEVVTLFNASSTGCSHPVSNGNHITDGPFLYRADSGDLYMIWSTFLNNNYAECLLKFKGGEIGLQFEHHAPLLDNDGGHGMIFTFEGKQYFSYHTPNSSENERPAFRQIIEENGTLRLL